MGNPFFLLLLPGKHVSLVYCMGVTFCSSLDIMGRIAVVIVGEVKKGSQAIQ